MSLSYTSASLIVVVLGLSTAAPVPRTSVGHSTDDRAALGEFEAVVSYDIATARGQVPRSRAVSES